jgi:1,5-anhydro-D-fructose reductase (1,5-anhydro-D-mannitol-forming)
MAGSTTVEWLIVGTGDIVQKRVAPALCSVEHCRVAGIVGQLDRARALADPLRAQAFSNLQEALVKSDATAVYVATPVHRHVAEAVISLQAGRHVLIEKPLAVCAADAAPLMEASRAQPGVIAGCAYYRRCSARFQHARNLLREATIGPVVAVRMHYRSWFCPETSDPKIWRVATRLSGGGPLADMGSHMFDVLIGLLGMPRTVVAKVATLTHQYEVEDSAAVLLEMAVGAQVTASFHWNSKSWAHEMEIIGTEGSLLWRPFDSGPVILTLGRDVQQLDLPPAANVHVPLVQDFVEAIRTGRAPVAPVAEALQSNTLLDAIYRSAETASEVAL